MAVRPLASLALAAAALVIGGEALIAQSGPPGVRRPAAEPPAIHPQTTPRPGPVVPNLPTPPSTVMAVKTTPTPVAVNMPLAIAVETKGECPQFKLDFGDGATGTSAGAAAAVTGGVYHYTVHHSYAAVGQKTITATGLAKCTGSATGEAQVVTAVVQGNNPVLPPKPPGPFVFTSVSYNYPGRVPVVANATNGVATVPYPSTTWPPISDDSTVAFAFLPPDMPDAAKIAFSTIPFGSRFCPNGAAGCPFKFTLTKFNVDIGPKTDYSGTARRYAANDNGSLAWVIHIPELDLRQLFADDWNYIIDMEWTFAGVTYKTSQAMMKRGDKFAGSYFEKHIYPTFLSERCQTCHAMGDHDTIIQHHDSKGVYNLDGFSTDLVGPGPHEVCQNCHFPPRVSDWRTPPFAQGIDWKTMTTWEQICNTAVSHLSAGALIEAGVQANMRNHFHNDPRVKWAISDAMTFPPVIEQLTRAPPGNWDAWLKIIDPWIEMTNRCSPG